MERNKESEQVKVNRNWNPRIKKTVRPLRCFGEGDFLEMETPWMGERRVLESDYRGRLPHPQTNNHEIYFSLFSHCCWQAIAGNPLGASQGWCIAPLMTDGDLRSEALSLKPYGKLFSNTLTPGYQKHMHCCI